MRNYIAQAAFDQIEDLKNFYMMARLSYEMGFVVDAETGNILHVLHGSEDELPVPDEALDNKNVILVHNHPQETSAVLSEADMIVAVYHDLVGIVAISDNGHIAAMYISERLKESEKAQLYVTFDIIHKSVLDSWTMPKGGNLYEEATKVGLVLKSHYKEFFGKSFSKIVYY